MRKDVILLVGGAQGSGLETTMQVLAPAYANLGYGVLANREYFSNIVGRHSYIHIRVSSSGEARPLYYPVDFLGAMDAETVFTHWDDIGNGGFLLYDLGTARTRLQQIASMEPDLRSRLMQQYKEAGIEPFTVEKVVEYLEKERSVRVIGLSFTALFDVLIKKHGLSRAQAQRFRSSILIGAIAGLTGLDREALDLGLQRRFGSRPKVLEINRDFIASVADEVEKEYGAQLKLEPAKPKTGEYIVASGNDAVAMGKVVGGIRYQAYYPITPASDESVLLEEFEGLKVDGESLGSIAILQTEDEIAAISSVIGAALTGARASTATSGPGFSLMVEALGWAGKNDVPIVITYYQRGGPSTGLPTRGSQSDLLFSLFASHGEFPRIILSSGDHLEAFYDAIEAYNLAERYQMPVIHMLDKFLANMVASIPFPDWGSIKIDRGKTLFKAPPGPFKRFPRDQPLAERPVLGSGAITWYTGDENDEFGHIDEDPVNRLVMYERRWKKMEIADREIPEDFRVKYYGGEDADVLLVGWGSVKIPALEAIERLREKGVSAAYLHLRMLSPLPKRRVSEVLSRFKPERVIAVEANYLGQASKIVTMETGFVFRKHILKWTGRPIYLHELVEGVLDIVKNGRDRVVLSYGK
ncbi:2-oxoacid:ferredoxin oxidoreductase subunit alpha [Aeropyrum camini]|uniref:2-oxoacid oxidoreductase (ferredoxin) n=1 Tax=Aeropyrum camini SY1 = JCM 12091 TaxID=1198449 RepID=U3TFI3_9CREN|nr:2-oxoacid:ferredoxin oxidoreductase subunit alpha [Aeropyrum camini]BAN90800.1 2-oxoacid:ferredoxin oxidoreductase subunit alpha [Aeropyrum camini SY1 = JCM 12091]